jgi:predicted kinase
MNKQVKCYILSGAPLSGKSTWAKKQGIPILSCDRLRLEYSGGKYIFDPQMEKDIWEDFYFRLGTYKHDFIIDNTNCKEKYINKIKECLNSKYEIEIIKFEASLWLSYFRNIKRWLFTGKWIPFKVIKNMKKNYKKLWKNE